MITYIAFLRSINVGGHNIFKMEDLRRYFEEMGLENVRTYIQSGNVYFDSKEKNEDRLKDKIQKDLAAKLGYEVEIVLRSKNDLYAMLDDNPFPDEKLDKNTVIYIYFIQNEPEAEKARAAENQSTPAETVKIRRRDVFLLYRREISAKLVLGLKLEKLLGQKPTSRNWETMIKMREKMG